MELDRIQMNIVVLIFQCRMHPARRVGGVPDVSLAGINIHACEPHAYACHLPCEPCALSGPRPTRPDWLLHRRGPIIENWYAPSAPFRCDMILVSLMALIDS